MTEAEKFYTSKDEKFDLSFFQYFLFISSQTIIKRA
jgi:hypothetical protein